MPPLSKKRQAQKQPPAIWVPKTIKIPIDSEEKEKWVKVEVQIHGACAVHLAQGRDEGWVITHLHSGRALLFVVTEEQAKQVGQFLWRKCCLVLREKTIEEVREKAPRWLRRWCRACCKHRKCFDPQPWIDEDKE